MKRRAFLGVTGINIVLCILVGVMAGLGTYTFWYAEGASYFSTDPKACMNCHIMREQHDSWRKSSHHAVADCNSCHMPKDFVPKYIAKAENGFWHSLHFTLQDFPEPIHITPKNSTILQNNCIKCHHDLVDDLLHLGSLGGEGNSCVRCHADVGHGPRR